MVKIEKKVPVKYLEDDESIQLIVFKDGKPPIVARIVENKWWKSTIKIHFPMEICLYKDRVTQRSGFFLQEWLPSDFIENETTDIPKNYILVVKHASMILKKFYLQTMAMLEEKNSAKKASEFAGDEEVPEEIRRRIEELFRRSASNVGGENLPEYVKPKEKEEEQQQNTAPTSAKTEEEEKVPSVHGGTIDYEEDETPEETPDYVEIPGVGKVPYKKTKQ